MRHYLTAAAAAVMLTLSSAAVQAQEDIVGSLTADETTKVGTFGKGVGQAYICADESARPEMLEDIRLIFNFVSQDMGTDSAFLYATAVGFGAGETAEGLDCDKLLTKWGANTSDWNRLHLVAGSWPRSITGRGGLYGPTTEAGP